MPPKVATPQQAAAAQAAAATMTDVRNPNATGSGNRFQRTRPLTKFERDALRVPVPCVYVYNISPIFKWAKDYPGLGPMTLMPRKEDERVSEPIVLHDRLVRGFDGGNGIRRLMVENPLDIVQDFLCCSPDFPGRPENNLTRYGCFYTEAIPLSEMPPKSRKRFWTPPSSNIATGCMKKWARPTPCRTRSFACASRKSTGRPRSIFTGRATFRNCPTGYSGGPS